MADFKIVAGNPTDFEVEAIAQWVGKLSAQAAGQRDGAANQWGTPARQVFGAPLLNPGSFVNGGIAQAGGSSVGPAWGSGLADHLGKL
ncbi:acyl-CoA carboxylase subunit epsilon [Corynebacterium ulceribovis]|uniref:acyl-CoA carboxylase subunit epsilon n=1 Tax=Corynebacterium ulceribovis TaxID=487732 RepID=UPI000370F267|nr:acyl-CoA carboxylase subunit epsilon [Corynebacterium ulceribovis]